MRLLSLSAAVGAGHVRAGQALDAAAREYYPDDACRHIEVLKYTTRAFRKLYADSYLYLVQHRPAVWGMLYRLMGRNVERKRLNTLVRAYDTAMYHRLMDRLNAFKPDAVVATHFLPSNVVLAHRGGRLPTWVVVTDYDVHSVWVNPKAEGYFVATPEVKAQLVRYGVEDGRVHVTGIPIDPVFTRPLSRAAARRKLGLPDGRVVLLSSGGFGVGDFESAIDRVASVKTPFTLAVVAGKNKRLEKKLRARCDANLRVFGFVTNMQDFMAAADLLISKSGGLTVSEALAVGTPMLVLWPIPGQEERNADYLLERGAAVKASSLDVLDFKLGELLEDPRRLDMMAKAATLAARPNAAREILRIIHEHAHPAR